VVICKSRRGLKISRAKITILGTPSLYAINPDAKHPRAELLYNFPDANLFLGITGVYPDVFTIVVGNLLLQTSQSTPHSYSIWKVDFSHPKKEGPSISKVVDLKRSITPEWSRNPPRMSWQRADCRFKPWRSLET
jgi:hypothetical protein